MHDPKAPEQAGVFPFTRGIHPLMYRERNWTMRQYAGFGTAKDTNTRFHHLLSQGQTGLSVAFDLPTQMGYDSDHALSRGEVGRVGVAIDTLADMEQVFAGIQLDQVSTSMTINATAGILLAMYAVVAERQGVDWSKLRGTVQNDILKEYVARGTFIYPMRPSMRLCTDIIAWSHHHVPQWNPISISGYHMREAGATAAQELAFTLAHAQAYIADADARGLKADAVGKRISFFFNAHNDFFEEIAKFRVARRMWATIMRDRFHAQDPQAQRLRFHAQTGGSTLTALQPLNNVVRTTLQALAAVLGGCQSLHTNGFDEALSLPSADSATLALRTQQVIAFESGVTQWVDPLGGADAVEQNVTRLEQEAGDYLQRIERMGGTLAALEQGFMQSEISESAYQTQLAIESGQNIIVGVNRFTDNETRTTPVERVSVESETHQVNALQRVKAARDSEAVSTACERLRAVAASDDNLMPAIVDAVRVNTSLGEISQALRDVFGVYRP